MIATPFEKACLRKDFSKDDYKELQTLNSGCQYPAEKEIGKRSALVSA